MHYQCEIIMPPTEDVEEAIASILKPFSESNSDNSFYDWYVIGGRFAGKKLLAKYDEKKLDEFHKWCEDEKITIAGFQAGKPEIKPSDQIPKVDAKWNEFFPHESGLIVPCILFKHSNNQYGNNMLDGDISELKDCLDIKCPRVIFAYENEATFMLSEDHWNGVNHMKVDWDCSIRSALEQFKEKLKHYNEEYANNIMPQDNWLVVTVDYHT